VRHGGDERAGAEGGDVAGPAVEDLARGGWVGKNVDFGARWVGAAALAVVDRKSRGCTSALDDYVGVHINRDYFCSTTAQLSSSRPAAPAR
jgi:hypothetical protein